MTLMPCPDIVDLERYLLRDLDAQSAASIATHVSACPECAKEAQDLSENLRLAPALRRSEKDDAHTTHGDVDPETVGPYRILRRLGQGQGRVREKGHHAGIAREPGHVA